jgi:hypothetical protein
MGFSDYFLIVADLLARSTAPTPILHLHQPAPREKIGVINYVRPTLAACFEHPRAIRV